MIMAAVLALSTNCTVAQAQSADSQYSQLLAKQLKKQYKNKLKELKKENGRSMVLLVHSKWLCSLITTNSPKAGRMSMRSSEQPPSSSQRTSDTRQPSTMPATSTPVRLEAM